MGWTCGNVVENVSGLTGLVDGLNVKGIASYDWSFARDVDAPRRLGWEIGPEARVIRGAAGAVGARVLTPLGFICFLNSPVQIQSLLPMLQKAEDLER